MHYDYQKDILSALDEVKASSTADIIAWKGALSEIVAICENELDHRSRVMPPKSYSLIAELKQFINSIINTIKGE